MIKITKLHIILVFFIIFISGIYYYQIKLNQIQRLEKLLNEARSQLEYQRIEIEKKKQEQIERERIISQQALAIAGEYCLLYKNKGHDIEIGRKILQEAKENFNKNNYSEAIQLAQKSIDEFKKSPYKYVYYIVKRGDCLWKIAKMPQHYNKGSLWFKIWQANKNKIPKYNLIYPRQKLIIPKINNNKNENSCS